MVRFENALVPFREKGNRRYLADEDLESHAWLREFAAAFSNCFGYSAELQGLVFEEPPDDPLAKSKTPS